jgi:tRNA threonylcarbamoyladenosine biosynthesis protein TsaB
MTLPYLLAIESSGRAASVALATLPDDGEPQLCSEVALDPAERTAKVLIPTIHRLLRSAEAKPSDLAAVAVTVGPGSFTGLRIGITAAKTIAFATGAKLVGTSTLDVLAVQAGPLAGGRIWAVIDAQRGDVFAGCYTPEDRTTIGEADRTQLLAGESWVANLATGDCIVGPVAERYADRLPTGIHLAGPQQCLPRARTVATLGYELIGRGFDADPFRLVPRYHRMSAAEEKARKV